MELDLRKLITILIGKLHILIAAAVLFGTAAYIITKLCITPLYAASGTMYVFNSENRQNATITSSDITTSQKLVDTYIVILQSNVVLEQVAKETNLGYSAGQIGAMFTAAAVNDTEVFRVIITNSNPQHAQTIANAFLDVAPSEIIRVVKAGSVEVIDHAKLPSVPVSPNLPRNTAIASLLGFVLAALCVILVDLLDTRVKTEADITDLLDIPILGIIPAISPNGKESGKK